MKSLKFKERKGKEWYIQQDIIKMLERRGWYVIVMTASVYLWGVPDLYATHSAHKPRWIEVKKPKGYSFTSAQREKFPKMIAHGSHIWILTAGTEAEYKKLFLPMNLFFYMEIK